MINSTYYIVRDKYKLVNSVISNEIFAATGQYLNNSGRIVLSRVVVRGVTLYVSVPSYPPMNLPSFALTEVRPITLEQAQTLIPDKYVYHSDHGLWYPVSTRSNPDDQ